MTRRVPITRLEKFFGQDDFALEIEMGREYLNGDLNFTLVLYSVDIQKTNKDDVYGEVINGGIQFQPPVEFRALVRIEEATNQYINGSRVMQNEPGNMTFSVYQSLLNDLDVDIQYGDYLAYYETESRVRYYNVVNDGRVVSDNKHSYGGYRSFYRTILATFVNENEFKGI